MRLANIAFITRLRYLIDSVTDNSLLPPFDLRVDLVDVIGNVHVVADGVLVSVFHDEVLIKEADGLLRRRGGEADEIGVEVCEYLAPQLVDGAVAFIRDDEVEGLDGDVRVVNDGRRLFPKRLAQVVAGAL